MANTDRKQIGPRVPPELADDYKTYIREVNDGVYRGRLSEEAQEAIRLQLGRHYAENSSKLDQISEEDAERARRLRDYVEEWERAVSDYTRPGQRSQESKEVPDDLGEFEQKLGRQNDLLWDMFRKLQRLEDEKSQCGSGPA